MIDTVDYNMLLLRCQVLTLAVITELSCYCFPKFFYIRLHIIPLDCNKQQPASRSNDKQVKYYIRPANFVFVDLQGTTVVSVLKGIAAGAVSHQWLEQRV